MIKVIVQGLGPIGKGCLKLLLENKDIKIVGVVDINPELIGKDMFGIRITKEPDFSTNPDVLLLTTSSKLNAVLNSVKIAAEHNVNIVSPCEELFYPEYVDKKLARQIDDLAKENNIRILGHGVNPGCLMDTYPLHVLKNTDIKKDDIIKVYRWDNTINRRLPLLKKTGAGLKKEEFLAKVNELGFGHVGLEMSASYLADKLGLENYELRFNRLPVIAEEDIKPDNSELVKIGYAAGLNETCSVIVNGKEKIILDLRMFVNAKNKNCVEINDKIIDDYSNIVNGDIATLRILVDAINHVGKGTPGLNKIGYVPDPHILLF